MNKIKVAIDEGHWIGTDPGAVGIGGIQEAKINFNVGQYLLAELIKRGYDAFVCAKTAASDIRRRGEEARNKGAALFVSIHNNAGGGDGYEVIYQVDNAKSKQFAEVLAKHYEKIGQNKHGIYCRPSTHNPHLNYYGVLAGAAPTPGVISEFCYVDNAKDIQASDTLREQQAIAFAQADAIDEYFGRSAK